MPKIYFDERWPLETGIGIVSNEIRSLMPDFWNFTPLKACGQHAEAFAPWRLTKKLKEKKASRKDIFWNPGFVPPSTMVSKTLIQVHDLTHLHYYSRAHRLYYNIVYKELYKKTDRIITGSEYSRNELCSWAGLSTKNVDVIYHGVSDIFSPVGLRFNPGYEYILYPGNYRSYKNLGRLIQAYAASSLPKLNIHLLMTGRGNGELIGLANKLGIEDLVNFTGILGSAELAACFRSCKMVCFLSLYEGFGLPILEGLASGVPVLTSNVTSMPEVAGEAAYLVDPKSIDEIIFAMDNLIFKDDLRCELINRGLERAKSFSWQFAANKMSYIFEEMLQE